MNNTHMIQAALLGLLVGTGLVQAQTNVPQDLQTNLPQNLQNLRPASEDPLNRISLGYRMGYLLTAHFNHLGGLGPFSNPGPATGTYQNHNYDDGYVVRDSRNPQVDHYTWNWGFNSSSQISLANDGTYKSLTLHSLSTPATASTESDQDPEHGLELRYDRCLGHLTKWDWTRKWSWGLEGAFDFTILSIRDNHSLSYFAQETTDIYALDGLNPYMPNGTPYKGSTLGGYPGGGGPLIVDSPQTRQVAITPRQAMITGERKLEADVYGWQLGPYLEVPLGKHWAVDLSAGLAVVAVDGEFTFNETVTMEGMSVSRHGRTSSMDFMAGYYGGGRVSYKFDEKWSVYAGAQYQDVGLYKHSSNNKQAELDLGGNVFAAFGVSFSF